MSTQGERRRVGILGGTGLVGRALAARLSSHPLLCLGMIVGSPATAGKKFSEVWKRKEQSLVDHYGEIWKAQEFPEDLEDCVVCSFEELLASASCKDNKIDLVVSAIAASHGWMEEKLLDAGFDIFSISPYARFDSRAKLVVPEVNGYEMLTPDKAQASGGRLFKSPNCVSCGLSVVLDAVNKKYGLKEVSVTTFQTLSGRGDLKYDLDLVKGNVYPLRDTIEDTDAYIRREVKQIVGGEFKLSVTAQRVFAQRGHFVDVRIKTKSAVTDVHEAATNFASFTPLHGTPFEKLPSVPHHPIKVQTEPGFPRPVQAMAGDNEDGMSVVVGHLNTSDEVFDLTFSFVVDNIARGAYGAALINAECFYESKNMEQHHIQETVNLAMAFALAGGFFKRMFAPLEPQDPDYALHM